MNRRIRVLLMFGLYTGACVTAWGLTFIDSAPLGAAIVLDGQPTGRHTPAVFSGLSEGRHTVSVQKRGFLTVSKSFEVSDKTDVVLEVPLRSESLVLAFPESQSLLTPLGTRPTEGRQFHYSPGLYDLQTTDSGPSLTPVPSVDRALTASTWTLGVSIVVTLASLAQDFWTDRNQRSPSVLTVGLGAAVLAQIPLFAGLQFRQTALEREAEPSGAPVSQRLDRAETLFQQGLTSWSQGDLKASQAVLRRLVREFPDSPWVPGAWFSLAEIDAKSGHLLLAQGEYRLVAETFPQAAYYERAQHALAQFDGSSIGTSFAGYDRTLALFARGHPFTAEEITGFEFIKDLLLEQGAADLASDLDWVRIAVTAGAASTSEGR